MAEKLKKTRRRYNMEDSMMLQKARTSCALMLQDLAVFSAFDPNLNAAFATEWENELNSGNAIPNDELFRDQLQITSNELKQHIKLCRKKYNEFKYFVLRAYPTDAAMQQAFGLKEYTTHTRSAINLAEFLLTMHTIAFNNKATLIQPHVGYTEAGIEEIKTLQETLIERIIALSVKKNEQHSSTNERIELFNKVYGKFALVASAAKIIYANNFAKYEQYLIYEKKPKKEKPVSENLTDK